MTGLRLGRQGFAWNHKTQRTLEGHSVSIPLSLYPISHELTKARPPSRAARSAHPEVSLDPGDARVRHRPVSPGRIERRHQGAGGLVVSSAPANAAEGMDHGRVAGNCEQSARAILHHHA